MKPIALTTDESARIDAIIQYCNPMLSREALAKIYLVGKRIDNASLAVEVGTGHGSGTIALGLGLLDSSPAFRLVTFDKIVGGSRERFGDFEANVKIIRDNLSRFGLDEHVTVQFCNVDDGLQAVPDGEIDVLMIDADGRIDREFLLFYHRLRTDGVIIIDDCVGGLLVNAKSFTFMRRSIVRGKHRPTEVLVTEFIERGLIEQIDATKDGQTRFFRKPPGAPQAIELQWVIDAYRRLIPSPASFEDHRIVFVLPRPPRSLERALRRLRHWIAMRRSNVGALRH